MYATESTVQLRHPVLVSIRGLVTTVTSQTIVPPRGTYANTAPVTWSSATVEVS